MNLCDLQLPDIIMSFLDVTISHILQFLDILIMLLTGNVFYSMPH